VIRYALACAHEHTFEGWFGASGDFDDQASRGLLTCPVCGTAEVRKQIMAPAVAGTKRNSPDVTPQTRQMMMEALGEVRRHVEENFDYVGDSFAREARAIHEGRSEVREIYGEATSDEARKLVEDGIPVAALPDLPPAKRELN